MKRKHFIQAFGSTALVSFVLPAQSLFSKPKPIQKKSNKGMGFFIPKKTVESLPHSESYWGVVAKNFNRPQGFINLENGYFSHQPIATLDYHGEAEARINTQSSFFMRSEQSKAIEDARNIFAGFQGWDVEEVAFTRNTTESLNTIIMGTHWQLGDEVIIGDQDYGSMVEAFQQAAARWGIVIKVAQISLYPASDQEIIQAYVQQITARTKMLHVTHMINLNGHLIPVQAIVREAKQKQPNLWVVVDAAHSLAHIPMNLSELSNAGADIIGGSLHKWLCNPIGVGFLYVKRSLIREIWPLMGDIGMEKDNIRKYEHQGTRPINSLQTISKAIAFHQLLGATSKYNRLLYLKLLWIGNKVALETFGKSLGIFSDPEYQQNMNAVHDLSNFDNFKLQSPLFPFSRGGAIATAAIDGYTPTELSSILMTKFTIFTVGINHPIVRGVRVTPHLSNAAADCIALNKALTILCKDLIPHNESIPTKK
ncbi:MAG: aminotransferase class V-fold PLP-dependent enzyme [Flavobacteriaceae bacterium]|nr:aminotransferase class V-fold PLP-dependent enzyme [Flavobacteriaceae bacterium]